MSDHRISSDNYRYMASVEYHQGSYCWMVTDTKENDFVAEGRAITEDLAAIAAQAVCEYMENPSADCRAILEAEAAERVNNHCIALHTAVGNVLDIYSKWWTNEDEEDEFNEEEALRSLDHLKTIYDRANQ